jgi:hypothetical protein
MPPLTCQWSLFALTQSPHREHSNGISDLSRRDLITLARRSSVAVSDEYSASHAAAKRVAVPYFEGRRCVLAISSYHRTNWTKWQYQFVASCSRMSEESQISPRIVFQASSQSCPKLNGYSPAGCIEHLIAGSVQPTERVRSPTAGSSLPQLLCAWRISGASDG